jgi:hypothetical protein
LEQTITKWHLTTWQRKSNGLRHNQASSGGFTLKSDGQINPNVQMMTKDMAFAMYVYLLRDR